MALAQLRVAHDLRDNAIGMFHLLLNHLNLFGRLCVLVVLQGPLQRERGRVDDRQRVLNLVNELGRHAAR